MKKVSKLQLKRVRELLRDRGARDKNGLFVIEGQKLVKDVLAKRHKIEFVLVSGSFAGKNEIFISELEANSVSVFKAVAGDFEKISSLRNSQGVLAVVYKAKHENSIYGVNKNVIAVLCDGVQDPGNLGSIIRISAAFGVNFILIVGMGADVYNPKVVRASGGMMLDIPIHECTMTDLDSYKKNGYQLLVSSVRREAGNDLSEIDKFSRPLILAFGSEGKGVSEEIKNKADGFFYIPVSDKVESLNVSIAVAITLYEVTEKWKKFV